MPAENRVRPMTQSITGVLDHMGKDEASGLEGAKLLANDALAEAVGGRPVSAATRMIGWLMQQAPKRGMDISVRNLVGQKLLASPQELESFLATVRQPKPRPFGLFGGMAGGMGAAAGFNQPTAPAPVGLPVPGRQ